MPIDPLPEESANPNPQGSSHMFRSFWERASRLVGHTSAIVPVMPGEGLPIPTSSVIDTTSLPIPKGQLKAYKTPRSVADIDLIVVHVTAVTGGFGIRKGGETGWKTWLPVVHCTIGMFHPDAARREASLAWEKLQEESLIETLPGEMREQIFALDVLRGWSAEELAKAIALWHRYRGTPYHFLASPRTNTVLANRLPMEKTWAANAGGNDGISFAVDCGAKEDFTPSGYRCCRVGLVAAIQSLRSAQQREYGDADHHVIRIAPHRAFSPKRRADNSRLQWQNVVLPVEAQFGRVEVDYEVRMNGGRAVPISWDDDALYDDRGRRI